MTRWVWQAFRASIYASHSLTWVGLTLRLVTFMKAQTTILMGLLFVAAGCGDNEREVRYYREIRFAEPDSPAVRAAAQAAGPAAGAMPAGPAMAAGAGDSSTPDRARAMGNLPAEALGEQLPLGWAVPAGWEDRGPSGIRIATLVVEGQECTILSFPGDVGGDEANIRRWLGQINQSPPDDAVVRLLGSASQHVTRGGFDARIYDFADILPSGAPLSTMAAMVPVGEQTVFVKFTGETAVLARQKEAFMALVLSLELKPEAAY